LATSGSGFYSFHGSLFEYFQNDALDATVLDFYQFKTAGIRPL
jgi:hypothetical protein